MIAATEPTEGIDADLGGEDTDASVLSAEGAARMEAMRNQGRSATEPKACVLCGKTFAAIPSYPPVCRLVDATHTKARRLLWPLPDLWTAKGLA